MVDSGDADRGVFGYGLGAGIGGPRTPLRQFEGRQARNRMLELSLILLAGAILILPSDWRQGLFWWLQLRKHAAGQRVVVLAAVAMDCTVC